MVEISVIMSVYNGSKYLRESIDSIINQTFNNFEFIICDDSSSDESLAILLEYAQEDSRIKIIQNETNLGLAASLNKCIDIANGRYIVRMDDDDISMLNRFELQYKFMEENPQVAFSGSYLDYFDENGIWGSHTPPLMPDKFDVFKGNIFDHPTIIMRKEILVKIGKYTVEPYTIRGQDYDLWCKFYANGYIGANIDRKLLKYRRGRKEYNKSKFIYRWYAYRKRAIWRKRLALPNQYIFLEFKPLLAAFTPNSILYKIHKNKYSQI